MVHGNEPWPALRVESRAAALLGWVAWFIPALLPAVIVWGHSLRSEHREAGMGALVLGWIGVVLWVVVVAVLMVQAAGSGGY